jgi:HSP20 family protein
MANIVRRNERGEREVAPRGRGYGEVYGRPGIFDPLRLVGELLRWDPFADYEGVPGVARAGGFMPAVDVRESPDAYHFRVDLPGVKDDEVEISLTGNRLTISGQRQEEKRDDRERYHSYELCYGSFSRSFTLPDGTDADNVRAEMKNGVLEVTVPKRPEVKPRRIAIGQGQSQGQGGDGGRGQAKS